MKAFLCFASPRVPLQGPDCLKSHFKRLLQMQPRNAAWSVLNCFGLNCFLFFFPKNQFWVSRFVEASVCRVLCECVNLVTNY